MKDDILKVKWRQIRGQVQAWWGNLTDDDLDRINGRKDMLIGIIQQRYGYMRVRAMAEVDRRLGELNNSPNP